MRKQPPPSARDFHGRRRVRAPRVAPPDDIWRASDHLPGQVIDRDDFLTDPSSDLGPIKSGRGPAEEEAGGLDGEEQLKPASDIPELSEEERILADNAVTAPEISSQDIEFYEGEEPLQDEWPDDLVETDPDDSFGAFAIDHAEETEVADVPDFDRNAFQPPWERDSKADDDRTRRARTKAASIVAMLSTSRVHERDEALDLLTDFFILHPYNATFKALTNAANADADLELLKAMIALREIISQRSELWVGRYGSRAFSTLRHRASAFSWVLVRRICKHQSDYPPEMMLSDDWLTEWYDLSPGDAGYWSFPLYIQTRIQHHAVRALHDGMSFLHRDGIRILPAERCGTSEVS